MADQPPPRRRFQFRLRTLMIGVTLASVACWGWVLYRRVGEYRYRAHFAEEQAEVNRQVLGSPWIGPRAGWTEPEVRQIRTKKLTYFERLAKKYAFLADHPWLYCDPDPPAPEFDKNNLEPPPTEGK
jgi:hypothetical protein